MVYMHMVHMRLVHMHMVRIKGRRSWRRACTFHSVVECGTSTSWGEEQDVGLARPKALDWAQSARALGALLCVLWTARVHA